MTNSEKPVIIGAGLAGIGLMKRFKNARCYEQKHYPLGHAASFEFDEVHLDQGAHICHSDNEKWLKQLNLEQSNHINASNVQNLDDGKMFGYPVQNNLGQVPKEVRTAAYQEITSQKWSEKNSDDMTYEDWCTQSYGTTLTQKYYDRFTKKYWRSNMSELGIDWLGGRLIPIDIKNVEKGLTGRPRDQSVFKTYYYPQKGGFANLFSKILDKDLIKRVRYNHRVNKINTNKKLIEFDNGAKVHYTSLFSTMPLTEFVAKDSEAPRFIKDCARQLRYTKLFTLGVKYEKLGRTLYPDWFYVYDNDIDISRVFNINSVTASKLEYQYFQCETFRRDDEEHIEDDTLHSMLAGVERIFNEEPVSYKLVRSDYAYIVPTIDTPKLRDTILKYYESVGVLHHGLYGKWRYIWSDAAFMDGRDG